MDINQAVGRNMRRIRTEKGLTLEQAAKVTGVSRSMLTQIEKGDVNPTITLLWKIANGYKVSFTSLVETETANLVVRGGEITPLVEGNGGVLNYPAFPFREDRAFETYRFVLRPQGDLSAQPHLAGTEEYLTVFSGQVEVQAGQEVFRLAAGDSLRFRADQPHAYRNVGEEEVQLHMLIYYGGRR